MKPKLILPFIISLIFFSILRVNAQANTSTVSKYHLPYEVLSTTLNKDTLTITGWAFINQNQHFLNDSTHEIAIVFQSKDHQFTKQATLTNLDMTSLMTYRGSPICKSNEFNKISSVCNYSYKNVGFTLSVNMDQFKKQSTYQALLQVKAKQTNTTYRIALYAPNANQLITMIDDYKFTLDSSLTHTRLVISHGNVVVRSGPSTKHPHIKEGASCSSVYTNQLFYKMGSVFNNIFDKVTINNVTYFQIGGQLDDCLDLRRRVKEGQSIQPMYIASSFVEYAGKMLTISSELINDPPVLNVTHPTIAYNELFNYKKYVSAYDKQEGDISDKIVVLSNNFKQQAGRYSLLLQVQDKHGASDQKVMNVTVTAPENTPPIIKADDIVVKQHVTFDPLFNVSAYDKEDGDLTHKVHTTNHVSTEYIGEFMQCYQVIDSQKAKANTCVNVSVIERDKIINTRFVSPAIKYQPHRSWIAHIILYNRQLSSVNAMYSKKK